MILTGLYDSPFARRVALALHVHGVAFERAALSVFGDFEAVMRANPLGRAPALQLDDGRIVSDSRAIIEWIEDPEAGFGGPMLAPEGAHARFAMLEAEGLAIGLADKAVARSAENRRPAQLQDREQILRLEKQMTSGLDWLERWADRRSTSGEPDRADLAAVCAATYLAQKWPGVFDADARPALEHYRAGWEARAPFTLAPFPVD
ncbi:glutathione S-transferase N-terminal domain-containing protein [Albimonas pacifica]|uniref:Glutathione S-transferase n=1 Tax=Albimonas pacifica TaxID=1114924 RepID=A0A1I3FQ42_9RHOB|nr:glutathione S-transferase N-terminal domain-containing protein [Albimonas pacifica]SFI13319.1 Glutathione S-transferase [Albimonas pacifica]